MVFNDNIMSDFYVKDNEKVSDSIYSYIRDSILNGTLKPGEKITTSHLAEDLRISMTPIRTALSQLADDGFIKLTQNRSAVVSFYSNEDVENIFYYRYTLEDLAARQACNRISEAEHSHLIDLARIIEDASKISDVSLLRSKAVAVADLNFHQYLIQCSHNPYVIEQYTELLPQIRFVRQFIQRSDLSPTSFAEEHYLICLVLKTKNTDFISSVINHHMMNHTTLKDTNSLLQNDTAIDVVDKQK